MKTDEKKLTNNDILRIANLANLKIRDDEIEKFRKQLSKIISYISKLNGVNTDNIVPTNQVTGLTNKTRDDTEVYEDSLTAEEALKNAPHRRESFFQVDAIFEDN